MVRLRHPAVGQQRSQVLFQGRRQTLCQRQQLLPGGLLFAQGGQVGTAASGPRERRYGTPELEGEFHLSAEAGQTGTQEGGMISHPPDQDFPGYNGPGRAGKEGICRRGFHNLFMKEQQLPVQLRPGAAPGVTQDPQSVVVEGCHRPPAPARRQFLPYFSIGKSVYIKRIRPMGMRHRWDQSAHLLSGARLN